MITALIILIGLIVLITIIYNLLVKECPYCKEPVNKKATKCPHCQSDLK